MFYGGYMRETREAHGMTIAQVAERSGIDAAHIAGLEDGTVMYTTIKKLLAIADAIGVTLNEMFHMK